MSSYTDVILGGEPFDFDTSFDKMQVVSAKQLAQRLLWSNCAGCVLSPEGIAEQRADNTIAFDQLSNWVEFQSTTALITCTSDGITYVVVADRTEDFVFDKKSGVVHELPNVEVLPGGKREAVDGLSALACICREIEEEMLVKINNFKPIVCQVGDKGAKNVIFRGTMTMQEVAKASRKIEQRFHDCVAGLAGYIDPSDVAQRKALCKRAPVKQLGLVTLQSIVEQIDARADKNPKKCILDSNFPKMPVMFALGDMQEQTPMAVRAFNHYGMTTMREKFVEMNKADQ